MALALGIDTGGTYTDCVIIDLDNSRVVAKAKANTTYDDLTIGISNSINSLSFASFKEIKLVSLSTTLATNAVVEGRGCEVGLILIGENPVGEIPVNNYVLIPGGHDIRGNIKEELDLMKVEKALGEFIGKVDAIAISGFASVRNPEHELMVKDIVARKLKLPVVCGHELTTSLGFHERTVTAVLNARLIPIITELIASVRQVLSDKGIVANLMIVKGDGTLMSEALAIEKPIDTLLSGPAASIIGATALTKEADALVLDMGGTTTDIAILKQGTPKINPEGARVGGWLTRVEAADIDTCGLGGDSYLRLDKDMNLLIGPNKACPLSFAGGKYPYLFEELQVQLNNLIKLRVTNALDSYMLLRKYDPCSLTETEKNALVYLESGPHTLFNIANAINKNPFSFDLDRLVNIGVIIKVAVTPTDILHAKGVYKQWNEDIALLGIEILAQIMGKSIKETLKLAFDMIVENICLTVLRAVLNFQGVRPEMLGDLQSNYFINRLLSTDNDDLLNIRAKLAVPIIGIGAPVGAYLPSVAAKLNSELIIPEHSEVANAIGAATGKVMERVKFTIKSSADGFLLYSQWERKSFDSLENAKTYALDQADKQAKVLAKKAGAVNYKVTTNCQDIYANEGYGPHVETLVEANVIGRPDW